jgi:hypothetical protein
MACAPSLAHSGGFPEPSSFVDPLALGDACARDVPYLEQLGVNAVRAPCSRRRPADLAPVSPAYDAFSN